MSPERIAELVAKTGKCEEIVKPRGFTADEFSVHVVTRGRDGQLYRVSSHAGFEFVRAQDSMGQFHHDTGRCAWLVRGHSAAYLPLFDWLPPRD